MGVDIDRIYGFVHLGRPAEHGMKVVVIGGKMCSGKTTLAERLSSRLVKNGHTVYRAGFASPLKKAVSSGLAGMIGVMVDAGILSETITESSQDGLETLVDVIEATRREDVSKRELLQWFGTNVVRGFDPDYWVREIAVDLKWRINHIGLVTIIDDWRFKNEKEGLVSSFGKDRVLSVYMDTPREVRVQRGCPEEHMDHPSEAAIGPEDADIVVRWTEGKGEKWTF